MRSTESWIFGIMSLVIIKEVRQQERFCRPEENWFRCKNRNCVRREYVRDGSDSCKDGSDEEDPLSCADDEIKSRFNSQCIRRFNSFTRLSLHGVCSEIEEYRCTLSGKCIPRSWVMDNIIDCTENGVNDTSDENQAIQCIQELEFSCSGDNQENTMTCITRRSVRDGIVDCVSHNKTLHALDEKHPLMECFNDTEFCCVENGRCIPRYQVFDGFPDCKNGSDEKGPIECLISLEFRCNDTGRCIPRSWRSNNIKNCPDGSDEIPLLPGEFCQYNETLCNNGKRCIPNHYLCDGIDQCGDCSDEIENCLPEDRRMFRCPNDPQQKCIYWEYSCDAFADCPNGGDDVTSIAGFKCNRNLFGSNEQRYCVIPQWSLQDNFPLCDDQSDICYQNGTFVCTKCLDNKTIISPRQVCDGIFDCPDLSDECLCEDSIESSRNSKPLCDNVCYGSTTNACDKCSSGEVFCPGDNLCINKSKVCDGAVDCSLSDFDEMFCGKVFKGQSEVSSKTFQCDKPDQKLVEGLSKHNLNSILQLLNNSKSATKCDNVTECPNFEDECSERANCPTRLDVCTKIPMIQTDATFLGFGTVTTRKCDGLFELLIGKSVCNGIKECQSGFDEAFCPNRFSCYVGNVNYLFYRTFDEVSIPFEEVCDGIIQCKDKSDEMNCSSKTHFYCAGGEPLFVPSSNVADGFADCEDESDECPESYLSTSAISSNVYLIVSPAFNTFLWIMALFACFGNAFVILTTFRFLIMSFRKSQNRKTSPSLLINRSLILNLAVADFLMGIALCIIIAKTLEFSGDYCLRDRSWRSSSTCDAVGVIIVLSSEVSVLTLVCLTSYRLYHIIYPYKSRQTSITPAFIWICVIWFAASLLAIVPLLNVFSLSLIGEMWIERNPYFSNVTTTWGSLKLFSKRLISLNGSHTHDNIFNNWYSLQSYFENNFYLQAPKTNGYFGYYSASGLCIPRFYKTNDDATDLSLLSPAVILFNFLALVYIAGAYVMIYRQTTSNRPVHSSSDNNRDQAKQLQRKVTTLIGTDMFCWLPICIMTFVSAGGVALPSIAYAFSAIILLPINSSLNPIIYTDVLAVTWKKAKKSKASILACLSRSFVTRRFSESAPFDETGRCVSESRNPNDSFKGKESKIAEVHL